MSTAAERKAFEDMMAEISESDEEDYPSNGKNRGHTASPKAMISPSSGGAAAGGGGADSKSSYGDGRRRGADSKEGGSADARNRRTNADSKSDMGGYYNNNSNSKNSKGRGSADGFSSEIDNFGVPSSASGAALEVQQKEQISISKRWLTRPYSRSDSEKGSMKCYVERERAGFGMHTVYRCYLENTEQGGGSHTGATGASGARFMMSAKKKVVNKTSYYLVTVDMDADDRGSDVVLGKVRGNAVGSRYLITDHGLAPEKSVAPSTLRKEFGVVSFEFDSGGPSRIEAWVPSVSSSGNPAVWQPGSEQEGMEARVEQIERSGGGGRSSTDLINLQNKQPKWDEAHGGHVLNFQGRVTESSVKNFQLCSPDGENVHPEDIVLQFGRVGKHRFTMDLKFPLSPLQAFSICVACLDGKIADRKGYEYIRKITGVGGGAGNSSSNNNSNSNGPGGEAGIGAAGFSGKDGAGAGGKGAVHDEGIEGSMRGGAQTGISGMIPSKQYLKDKINRSFK